MNIRLVVSDVDGTLLTKDKRVTPAALEAIRRLRDRGIRFTIISSRPPQGLRVVGDVVRLTDPVPAFNGGLIVAPDLKTVLREKLIEPVVTERLLQTLMQPHISVWVYTHTDWYVPDLTGPYVQHEIQAVKYPPNVRSDFCSIPLDRVAKIVGVSEDFPALAALDKQVQREFRGAVSATRSQDYYLDITHPDANKGEGILLISKLTDIPTSQIAVLGDMQNDIPMFRQSGLSIAMGNATPEVQREATLTTATNEEDGFAEAVEKHILTSEHQVMTNGMKPMMIVVMGVSGVGKSTVGAALARRLRCDFVDADRYHSPENVKKMSAGIPLTDAERQPWLETLHQVLLDYHARQRPVVLACSALQQSYRDLLGKQLPLVWVYLKGSEADIRSRLEHRHGHFASPALLRSQLAILEEPKDAITVAMSSEPDSAVREILGGLNEAGRA